ncbi:MAG: hypothetical protein RLW62_10765 [Gammaproteobacteria bacterium]
MSDLPPPLTERDADGLGVAALREIVENQLRDATPPAVPATLARLLDAGISRDDAVHYIACALSVELFEILVNDGAFDAARYADHLAALPALPYDAAAL